MKLRAFLFVLVATGCVTSDEGTSIEVLPDDSTAAGPDRELSDTDNRTGSPGRVVDDVHAFGSGSHGSTGWAFGVGIGVGSLDAEVVVPDTDVKNPDVLVASPDTLGPTVSGAVFSVSTSKLSRYKTEARASANNLVIAVPGLTLRATEVTSYAMAETLTNGDTSSSTNGSVINELEINGVKYGRVATTQTITVPGIAQVVLLARQGTGTAVVVDGIRVRVHDQRLTPEDESTEIVVSHAEAYYPEVIQH